MFDVRCIIIYHKDRESKEALNPYLHEGRIEEVIEELREMNKQSFFDFDTPLQIVKSYEDKVSIMLSKLYDINDFEDLLNEFRWLYFHIQSERCQIDNLQHEATIQPPEIPTPALICLCKHDEDATATERARELCDRCRGQNLSPGKVIAHLFRIGCVITSKNQYDEDYQERYVAKVLKENGLITSCGKDTIRKAIKRELE